MNKPLYNPVLAKQQRCQHSLDYPCVWSTRFERKGALNKEVDGGKLPPVTLRLFAAFDTRTGLVWGQTFERKRQEEFIAFLEYLDREIPESFTMIHIVLDNLKGSGKYVVIVNQADKEAL